MKKFLLATIVMIMACVTSKAAVTIYYDNSATGWSKVNIHYWSGAESSWPGKAMTQVNDNVWAFTFTSSVPGGFLFNDSSGKGDENQTADYSGKPVDGHIYKGAGGAKGKVTDMGVYEGSGDPLPEKPTVKAKPGNGTRFTDNVTVTLTVTPEATIYYTTNGTEPTTASAVYSEPLTFTDNTTLKTLAVTAEGTENAQSFTYTKRVLVDWQEGTHLNTDYYQVNPNGKCGTNRTVNTKFTKLSQDNRMCTADNALSNWTEDDLIIQGVARDIASAFRGKHEYPVIDTYAVYAAYDADNLYLGIQYVYSVWDAYGDGKADNLRAKPYQMDGRIMLAFDLDPNKEFEGVLTNGNTIWDADGQYNKFANGTDCIWLGSTKPTVGTPGLFFPNADGKASYDAAYCLSIPAPFYGLADGLLPSIKNIWGQEKFEGDPDDLLTNTGFVDLIDEVPTSQHTFYEFRFPLSKLGITENYIKNTGIGVMVIDTYGQGAISSNPYDPATFDNAKTPYSKDESTSAEKEDMDIFTSPHARIGKLSAGVNDIIIANDSFDANAPVEYYNLQGVRLSAPCQGICIARRGNKVQRIYKR